MRYFDCHLHLPSPDDYGFVRFREYMQSHPNLVGCNLILNSEPEMTVVERRLRELPDCVQIVPPLPLDLNIPDRLHSLRWYKIHPALHRISRERIPAVVSLVGASQARGVVVHHFPWGDKLEYNTSLELIIQIAQAYPELPVVATHGGGYESWQLRAHTARLKNIYYDFSISFSVYAETDYVKPWIQYVERRRNRILFGSDWPSAEAEPQLKYATELAQRTGMKESELELQLLENSARLWPRCVMSVNHENR